MQKYYAPIHRAPQFNCVHCGVYSSQIWGKLGYIQGQNHYDIDEWRYCVCGHCSKWSYWYEGRMIVPSEAPVPLAHVDMPEECKADYDEARNIVVISPRAASALIRLSLQKLMIQLGEKGKNINDDIANMVQKGLPIQIQQALDYCRVVGNHAVHPGELDLNDTPEIAHQLFTMMNFIIEDRIARPKQIQALYEQLPEGARAAIEKRDGN